MQVFITFFRVTRVLLVFRIMYNPLLDVQNCTTRLIICSREIGLLCSKQGQMFQRIYN